MKIFLFLLMCGMVAAADDPTEKLRGMISKAAAAAESVRAIEAIEREVLPGIEKMPESELKAGLLKTLTDACAARRVVLAVTKEEVGIGVERILLRGPWRVREGKTNGKSVPMFGADRRWRKFCYATQTAMAGGKEWTLGARQVETEKKPESDYEALAVQYLQGPKTLEAGKPVKFQFSTGKGWRSEGCRVLDDGTIDVRHLLHNAGNPVKVAWFRFGETEVQFDLRQWWEICREVSDSVWKEEVEPEPEKPKPVPPPR